MNCSSIPLAQLCIAAVFLSVFIASVGCDRTSDKSLTASCVMQKSETASDSVVVGMTRAVLGDDFFKNVRFWYHTFLVVRSLEQNSGYLSHQVRGSVWKGDAWTLTVWEDEASLERFVGSKTHRAAMKKGWAALERADFARIVIARSDLPISWPQAEAFMKEHGRSIKPNGMAARGYGQ